MCSKKIFGGSKPKEAPTPAVAQAAPTGDNLATSQLNAGETNTNAKGKKKLIINSVSGVGTGVNL